MTFSLTDIPRLLPELLLLLLAVFVIGSDVLERWGEDEAAQLERRRAAATLTAVGLGLVMVITAVESGFFFTVPPAGGNVLVNILLSFPQNLQAAGSPALPPLLGAFSTDSLTMVARLLFAGAALVVTLLTMGLPKLRNPAEFYGLLLTATLGMCVMAGSVELILAYVALELSSISLYVLAGYVRDDPRSAEAGMKYFLFGAISSAVLLYGMSLAYGFTASEANRTSANVIATLFAQVGQAAPTAAPTSTLTLLALLFIVAGLGYKIAAVPFHGWAPDVYQGAPPAVTTLIATASKTAGFVLIFRVLTLAFPSAFGGAAPERFEGWAGLVALIAAATVLVGNLAALRQTSLRRMLAYSGIGHTGFILTAMTLAGAARLEDRSFATSALLTYLAAYVVTSLAAFGAIAVASEALGGDTIDRMRGLGRRSPGLAALLTLALLSLAGIPPLAGFWGKLLVFLAAYRAGAVWLVALALGLTVVALAYYLRVVRALWQAPEDEGAGPIPVARPQAWALGVAGALVVLLGLIPGQLWGIFERVTAIAGR